MHFTVKASNIAILLFMASSSWATISQVQISTGTNTLATSVTVTLGSNPMDGDLEVLNCGNISGSLGSISSISQTGASWNFAVSTNNANSQDEIWYAYNVLGAAVTITVNLSHSLTEVCNVVEYSGFGNLNPLDLTASMADSGQDIGGDTPPQTGLTTLTNYGNELWWGGVLNNSMTTAGTPTNGFTYVGQPTVGGTTFLSTVQNIVSAQGDAGTTTSFGNVLPLTYYYSGTIATFTPHNSAGVDPLPLEGIGG